MQRFYQKNTSLIIAIVFAVILGGWYGWQAYSNAITASQPLTPIKPSTITFLGLSPHSGYRIIIINDQPYIIQQSEQEMKFAVPETVTEAKKRVPIDMLLRAINGDEVALGNLLVALQEGSYSPTITYKKVSARIPIEYKVLGVSKVVQAKAEVPVPADSDILSNKEAKAQWEQNLAGSMGESVQRLLNNCEVVLTEKHITDFSYNSIPAPAPLTGEIYTLFFGLSKEGRRRLFQETSKHVGEQLIIIADNIPVAAPVIQEPMNVNRADIRNVRSKVLLNQLIDVLKRNGVKVNVP